MLASGSKSLNITNEVQRETYDLEKILIEGVGDKIVSEAINRTKEDASNYVIQKEDVSKVFHNKGKKYKLLKIVKTNNSNVVDTENILRNIKLEVDDSGKMKVPNLFKVLKKKKRFPNYIRKKKQIYREDVDHYQKIEKDLVVDNIPEESHVTKVYAHFPPIDNPHTRTTREP